MKSSYSALMQSKYFNSAFNSAIFDGPLRVYFSQIHESLALKIYFLAQQKWPQEFAKAKELSKASHAHLLVMIYPTVESFDSVIQKTLQKSWTFEAWNKDIVIALRGPLNDSQLEIFIEEFGHTLQQWNPAPLEFGLPEFVV